ncbi:hypothetical protein JXK06_00690 [Patescibacteria group bacterium]|nr:hypothetical protein [Patescibacteria group bacterium]
MKSKKEEGNQDSKIDLEVPIDKALNVNEEIKKLQEKNLELSQEILASTLYVQKYIKHRRIFAAIKWAFIILIIIFGFLSFNFVFDYLQDTISSYQDQVNQIVDGANKARQ